MVQSEVVKGVAVNGRNGKDLLIMANEKNEITVRGIRFSEARVIELIEMYLDGRDRAAKQRKETSAAKAFYKDAVAKGLVKK